MLIKRRCMSRNKNLLSDQLVVFVLFVTQTFNHRLPSAGEGVKGTAGGAKSVVSLPAVVTVAVLLQNKTRQVIYAEANKRETKRGEIRSQTDRRGGRALLGLRRLRCRGSGRALTGEFSFRMHLSVKQR